MTFNFVKDFSGFLIRKNRGSPYIQAYMLLWRIDPLIGKNLETNNEKTAVAMQRRDKHACATIELLFETVFSARSMQRGYKEDNFGDPVI
jgi:hypothetical protein